MRRVALLCLLVCGAWAIPYSCTWTEPGGKVFDLSPLRSLHGVDYTGHGETHDYVMNLCGPSTTVGECESEGYSICQYDTQSQVAEFKTHLAFFAGNAPQWKTINGNPEEGISLTFLNGALCKPFGGEEKHMTVTVDLPCDRGRAPAQTFNVAEEDHQNCHYRFVLSSRFSCPLETPELPKIPTSYRAMVEYTLPGKNETFWTSEIYNEVMRRVRRDQFLHPGGQSTTLLWYDTASRYSIRNNSQCTKNQIAPGSKMESVFDLFQEQAARGIAYKGVKYQRGIPCDVWQGHWLYQHDDHSTGKTETVDEYGEWYFARENQNVVENPGMHRRPVAAVLRTNRTHAVLWDNELMHISFIDYSDDLNDWVGRNLELDPEWNCPDGPPKPVPRTEEDGGMSRGGVAALSIFLCLLGGAITFGGHWYYTKRRTGYYGEVAEERDDDGAY